MTAERRLARVQRLLYFTVGIRAGVWGAAAAMAALALAALADLWFGLPAGTRTAVLPAAMLAGLAADLLMLWRARAVARRERVALWLEERVPELRYALVTAVESPVPGLEETVARVRFEPAAWRAARRSTLPPLLAALAAAFALALVPKASLARVTAPRAGDALLRAGPGPGNALAGIVVRVAPPSYTGLGAQTLEDPVRVVAVTGSGLTVEGRTAGDPVTGSADSLNVAMTIGDGRWRAGLSMPASARVLRLRQGERVRLLLLEPRADSLPVVTLEQPVRDTVFRTPSGSLPLAVRFTDDFGLAQGWWELVVSSGEGENFRFRTVVMGRAGFDNATTGERRLTLTLDSLALAPGDLVHLRAVARDGNTATGPGVAGSDTRTLRIARANEYDSVAVEGLPPPDPLAGVLSQRMLILLTEALEQRRPRIARAVLIAESRKIAIDQNALRRQVGDVIFSRLEDLGGGGGGGGGEHSHDDGHDHGALTPEQLVQEAEEATNRAGQEPLDFAEGESPVVAINRPLLEAYNAMWDASRDLGVGDTRRALPHMYAALAAIQKARLAERFYLRGRTRDVVVDLGKVRLAGKKDGIGPGGRTPRESEDPRRSGLAARLDAVMARLGRGGAAPVVDSLLLLRAELLGSEPAAAGPLAAAIDALRAGRDATQPLVAARRALAGAAARVSGLGPWSPLP